VSNNVGGQYYTEFEIVWLVWHYLAIELKDQFEKTSMALAVKGKQHLGFVSIARHI